MKPTPKEILKEWFERVWKAREKNAIDALMADDAVAHLAGVAQVCGIAQFSNVHNMFFGAFPDLSVRILRSVGDDTQHACTGKFLPPIKAIFSELLRHIKELPSLA